MSARSLILKEFYQDYRKETEKSHAQEMELVVDEKTGRLFWEYIPKGKR